jgi:hypothetical protein
VVVALAPDGPQHARTGCAGYEPAIDDGADRAELDVPVAEGAFLAPRALWWDRTMQWCSMRCFAGPARSELPGTRPRVPDPMI